MLWKFWQCWLLQIEYHKIVSKRHCLCKKFTDISQHFEGNIWFERKFCLRNKHTVSQQAGKMNLMLPWEYLTVLRTANELPLNDHVEILVREKAQLYRGIGSAVMQNTDGPGIEKTTKHVILMFNNKGCRRDLCENVVLWRDLWPRQQKFLSIQTTRQFVALQHISAKANQTLTTIKDLPMIAKVRISGLTCSKEEFNKTKALYDQAFQEKDQKYMLRFHSNIQKTAQKGNASGKSFFKLSFMSKMRKNKIWKNLFKK